MNKQNGQKDRKIVEIEEHKRKKYKARSPRYPCISLREAVKNARALYEKNGRAFVAKEVAVKVWGYNKLHGRSLTILAAMAQYGLLHYQKGNVGISDDAFTIIEAPHNSSERKAALERCAKSPTIFDELFQSHPENLPSDDALGWVLKQRGFTTEGAQTTIVCLRDTNMFVKEELKDYIGGNEVKKEIEEHKELPPMQNESTVQHLSGSIRGHAQVTGTLTVNVADWVFPLDKGAVSLSWKGIVPTPDILEGLQEYLEVSKKRLKREKPESNDESE